MFYHLTPNPLARHALAVNKALRDNSARKLWSANSLAYLSGDSQLGPFTVLSSHEVKHSIIHDLENTANH